ncbi:MAG: DUF4399 domain-containing protein [Chromatiales bacterium]|nr:DUF4399 domain-containing protein [Chromatiales bacterium]
MRTPLIFSTLLITLLVAVAAHGRTPSPPGATLYIISPLHGEVVSNPVEVRFGLRGMGVAPVGIDRENTGHHHLLIDVGQLPPLDKPVPTDDNHKHFGGGQTEVQITLPPGEHTLQLLLGDQSHIPHSPPVVSKRITITVE